MAKAQTIQRRRVATAVADGGTTTSRGGCGSAVRVVPAEGPEHPIFQAPLETGEVLAIGIELPRRSRPDGHVAIRRALNAAAEWAREAGETPTIQEESSRRSLCLYLTGVDRPHAVMRAYVRALCELGDRVGCVALHRYRGILGQVSRNLVSDPRAPVQPAQPDDVASRRWWDRSFGPSSVAPASEPPRGLFSMLPVAGAFLSERRLSAIHFPDVRVVYGVPEAVGRDASLRSAVVADIVRAELSSSFGGDPPGLVPDARTGLPITPVAHHDRLGYGLRFRQHSAAMTAFYATSYRHREHELMNGLRGAVLALGLERTIHWDRTSGVYRVCLWEPLGRADYLA